MTETKSILMKHTLNRRSFLKSTGMGTVATLMPCHVMATSLAPLYAPHLDPGNEYSLLRIAEIFPEYSFPALKKYSTDQFSQSYDSFNFYQQFVKKAGTLEIQKKREDESVLFKVKVIREAGADVITELNDTYSPVFMGNYIFKGEVLASNDLLATPQSWLCETKITKGQSEAPFMNTGHVWSGSFRDGKVFYESGNINRMTHSVSGQLTWKWGLIHLVQKMAEQSLKEISFSTLDEMDLVYEYQRARLRKRQLIDTGRGIVEFTVVEVSGDGVIPTVYWIDDNYRVTFIISGVEAYVIS